MSEFYNGKTPVAPGVLDIVNDLIGFKDVSETGQAQLKVIAPATLISDLTSDPAAFRRLIQAPQNLNVSFYSGQKAGFLGDSITNSANAAAGRAFPEIAIMLCGSAYFSSSVVAGVPGNTTAQMLARYDTDIRAQGVHVLFVLGGTNDWLNSVPVADFAANIRAIAAKAREDGVTVIFGKTPPAPSGLTTAPNRKLIQGYNLFLDTWCPRNGAYVAETYSPLCQPNSSSAQDGYFTSTTDVHPNTIGHYLTARAFADAWLAIPKIPRVYVTAANDINDVIDPTCIGTGVTPTKPVSWYEQPGGTGTAATYSLQPKDGVLSYGKWARMDFDATALGGTKYYMMALDPKFSYSAGDVFLVTAKVRIIDVAGNYAATAWGSASTSQVSLRIFRETQTVVSYAFAWTVTSPGHIAALFTIPAGATALRPGLQVTLPTGTHIQVDIGEVGCFNLTKMAMAGIIP